MAITQSSLFFSTVIVNWLQSLLFLRLISRNIFTKCLSSMATNVLFLKTVKHKLEKVILDDTRRDVQLEPDRILHNVEVTQPIC